MDKSIVKEIGKVCMRFRIEVLDLSLIEFSRISNLNYKNVNAFEYGRANSIHYLMSYYKLCNDEQLEELSTKIFNIL